MKVVNSSAPRNLHEGYSVCRLTRFAMFNNYMNEKLVCAGSAFTLPELMVAVLAGSLFLLSMIAVFMTSSLSFCRMGDYINMDRSSRNALDQMSRSIRQSKLLTSYAPSLLVFNYDSGGITNLTYRYDTNAAVLTEEWNSTAFSNTNTLLTGCSNLSFSLYDRSLALTTNVSSGQGKVISVSWNSYGSTLLARKSTENMLQAKIVIRNQP